jgi:EAL domain-containing protein (putative c-di-GMP-specific phosphodiesterase class I)
VEALVRWQHPRRGLLQPRHFLRAVEEYGLMSRLTDFVMTEAVRQAGVWQANGLTLELIVNLGPGLVRDRAFPDRLATLLRESEFPPQQLCLDMTESTVGADRSLMLDVFTRLRDLGAGLSLDNFGTGLSSLTELYGLPFSEIKVDHSLIARVAREREAQLIVQAIANLGHTLQLGVCAEGVETRQTLEFIRFIGFDTAQGRFFAEPADGGEIERIVKAWPSSGPAASGSWQALKPAEFDPASTAIRRMRVYRDEGQETM